MALKGKKLSEEHKKKISASKKGKLLSDEHRRKISSALKGNIISSETKKKMSDIKKGKLFSEEHKKKISNSKKGKLFSKESRQKMSERHRGEKSYLWKGGISFEPYSSDWTKTLKRSIRERDNYTCQLCGKLQTEQIFAVHHTDYNKKNCNPENLITLCNSCHIKTNQNREYWKNYFNNRDIKFGGKI